MSRAELIRDRDWARQMEVADHRPDCRVEQPFHTAYGDLMGVELIRPDPACPGCVTDRQRGQWRAIADELDRWLGQRTSWGPHRGATVDVDDRVGAAS